MASSLSLDFQMDTTSLNGWVISMMGWPKPVLLTIEFCPLLADLIMKVMLFASVYGGGFVRSESDRGVFTLVTPARFRVALYRAVKRYLFEPLNGRFW